MGIGRWAIDKANTSARSKISINEPWAVAFALGTSAVCTVLSGPAETLARLADLGKANTTSTCSRGYVVVKTHTAGYPG